MYKCAKTEALLVTGKGLRRRMDEDTGILEAVDVVVCCQGRSTPQLLEGLLPSL